MANQPHPDKQAVTYRLHRDLVAQVKTEADRRGETVLALVTRALTREMEEGLTAPRVSATIPEEDMSRSNEAATLDR